MNIPKHAQLVQDIRLPHNEAFNKTSGYIDLPLTFSLMSKSFRLLKRKTLNDNLPLKPPQPSVILFKASDTFIYKIG